MGNRTGDIATFMQIADLCFWYVAGKQIDYNTSRNCSDESTLYIRVLAPFCLQSPFEGLLIKQQCSEIQIDKSDLENENIESAKPVET